MRWRIEGRSLAVLLALGGCAQDHSAHPTASDGSRGADGSFAGGSHDADAVVDADEPRSTSSDESVADPVRRPPRAIPARSSPSRPRVVAGVAITAPTHAEASEEPSVDAPRDDEAEARSATAEQRPAEQLPTEQRPTEQRPTDQEREIVAHCARLRSLPSWCVERERARVRKRGTP